MPGTAVRHIEHAAANGVRVVPRATAADALAAVKTLTTLEKSKLIRLAAGVLGRDRDDARDKLAALGLTDV